MAPPVRSFPAKDLPLEIQVGVNGRVRKTEDGKRIDLVKDCELLELFQYECSVPNPERRDSRIECWPIQRLFRRCQDKNGTFTVETSAWEGSTAPGQAQAATANGASHGFKELGVEPGRSDTKIDQQKSP